MWRREMLFVVVLLAVLTSTVTQDCSDDDFGVEYDGTTVFKVLELNQTCSCLNYHTTGSSYFGQSLYLGSASQINFANGLGQKIVLYGTSPTAYYGFGISSNTLEYHVDTASSSHVFYGGSTELFRIAGSGAVSMNGALAVSGASALGSVAVTGAASFGSTSTFGGLATFNNGLTVAAGATNILGPLTVSGTTSLPAVTFTGPVGHSSTSSFAGLATFSGGLTVSSGATSLASTLSVAGASTFSGGISITSGSLSVSGTLSAGAGSFPSMAVSGGSSLGSASVSSSLGVSGLLTATGGVSVTGGSLSVANALSTGALSSASTLYSAGLLTANGGINIAAGTVVDFGVGASREPSAGKMGYGIFSGGGGLDIVGAGTTSGNRQINMWDNVLVQSNFQSVGTTSAAALSVSGTSTFQNTLNVNGNGGGIVLVAPANGQGWSSASRPSDEAHIVNDRTGYNSLMIVGSAPAGGPRLVQMWDQLNVNGDYVANGHLNVQGRFSTSNTRTWQAVDGRAGCPSTHSANAFLLSLTVSFSQTSYVMVTGTMPRRHLGVNYLCLYVDGSEVNRHASYASSSTQFVGASVHWVGQLSATSHSIQLRDCGGLSSRWGCSSARGYINVISIG